MDAAEGEGLVLRVTLLHKKVKYYDQLKLLVGTYTHVHKMEYSIHKRWLTTHYNKTIMRLHDNESTRTVNMYIGYVYVRVSRAGLTNPSVFSQGSAGFWK